MAKVSKALILADSFNERFTPLTLEVPRSLIPIVNVPMIDYTIEFLASNGICDVIVFACSHASQIEDHLHKRWGHDSGVNVTVLKSKSVTSAGDAMREVYDAHVIDSHFILVSGDLVSNMRLAPIIKTHLDNFRSDARNILTMAFTAAGPRHHSRASEDDSVLLVDPLSLRLLSFDNSPTSKSVSISAETFENRASLQLRYDLLDCHIDICAPSVLQLFHAEFDYRDLRSDFIRGVLNVSELVELQNAIHIHVTSDNEYAVRVRDLPTYASVSMDVLHRWCYPIVPDSNWNDSTTFQAFRGFQYKEDHVTLARSCEIGDNTAIGGESMIGDHSRVLNSVIGRRCKIGKNVLVEGSFLWDDVTVEDGSVVKNSILSFGVVVKNGTNVPPGSVIGKGVVLKKEYPLVPSIRLTVVHPESRILSDLNTVVLQKDQRVAPLLPSDKSVFCWNSSLNSPSLIQDAVTPLPSLADVESEEENDDEDLQHSGRQSFGQEVADTLLRGLREGIPCAQTVLEIKSLRLTHDATFLDALSHVFPVLLADAKPTRVAIKNLFKKWLELIRLFATDQDDQLEVIYQLQECCTQDGRLTSCFCGMIHSLYEMEVLEEETILRWESECQDQIEDGDDEEETLEKVKAFLKQCKDFLEFLKNAEEEDDDD